MKPPKKMTAYWLLRMLYLQRREADVLRAKLQAEAPLFQDEGKPAMSLTPRTEKVKCSCGWEIGGNPLNEDDSIVLIHGMAGHYFTEEAGELLREEGE